MSWMGILKGKRVLTLEEMEEMPHFVSPKDKGYPSILNDLIFVTEEENDKILGYTSYKDMGRFYFVGNNYIPEENRRAGLWRTILNNRNKDLKNKPRITLVNPLEGTSGEQIAEAIKRMGGYEIADYSQVEDIMDEDIFNQLAGLPMYRYKKEE